MTSVSQKNEALPQKLILKNKEFSLCGIGARYVTFLKFGVYTVGLYVETAGLEEMKSRLASSNSQEKLSELELCSRILSSPSDVAIRLCPMRNTDGGHLKNGFSKFLKNDMIKLDASNSENQQALEELRGLVPSGKIAAGSTLTFLRETSGGLTVFVQDLLVDSLTNGWIGQRFLANYICKENPISQEARQSFLHEMSNKR